MADTESPSNEPMNVDSDNSKTSQVESIGNNENKLKNGNENKKSIELSTSSSASSSTSSSEQNIDKESNTKSIINGANKNSTKSEEEDIHDNIVSNQNNHTMDGTGTDSNHLSITTNTKIRKIRKIGLNETGVLMPGFEDVNDDQLAFSSESDFAIFIKQISSEIPLQRLVAVKRMIKSCHLWGEEAVLSVLPRVKQLSCDKEMVIRQAIAEVLGPFAKYLVETMSPHTYQYDNDHDNDNDNDNDIDMTSNDDTNSNDNNTTQTPTNTGKLISGIDRAHDVIITELLPLIKEMLKDAMEVRQGAGSSLIIIAELLNKEQVYEHILKIVLHMAHDDSDDQKITALPLLGDLAPIVGSAVCKNYLSADLHALSQDNSFRVRKATVQYFGPICEQLGNMDAEECLLPIFLSLCSDSIWSVRKGCVESFVDVSSSISSASRVKLIPIMEKFLNDSSRWVRNTAYEILGPFISSLSSEQISGDFLKYFTSIPHLSSAEADADCTNHCAFNFPAVVLTVGKERWSELNDTYNILCRKTFKSRKTLACSIHEIASVLGEELTEKYLLNSIEFFLKDIDDIRQGIIKNLWKILTVFNEKLRIEYISVLWELSAESDVNWRFRLLLAQQLDEILYLYKKSMIKQQIVPLIFQLCHDRMADVRYAAVYPIADAINILSKPSEITEDTQTTTKGDTSTTDTNEADTTNEDESKDKDDDENNNKNDENIEKDQVQKPAQEEAEDDDDEDDLQCIAKKLQSIYKGKTFSRRLLFIRMADSCFPRIDNELFDRLFLQDMNVLTYANDKIFNVRFCLARFIGKHLLNNERYKDNEQLSKAIEILRNDDEDVEIKRFFMTEDEIENWLQFKKQERTQKELQQRKQRQMMDGTGMNDDDDKGNEQRPGHQASKSKDSDLDSTDSSLYSSSDSDGNDDDDDDEEFSQDDKLKSVSDQLKGVGDDLTNNKLEDMDITTIGTNELSEAMLKDTTNANNLNFVEHEDTPYKLDIPKSIEKKLNDDEQEKQKNSPVGNYGLPIESQDDSKKDENDENENNEDQQQQEQQETEQTEQSTDDNTNDMETDKAEKNEDDLSNGNKDDDSNVDKSEEDKNEENVNTDNDKTDNVDDTNKDEVENNNTENVESEEK